MGEVPLCFPWITHGQGRGLVLNSVTKPCRFVKLAQYGRRRDKKGAVAPFFLSLLFSQHEAWLQIGFGILFEEAYHFKVLRAVGFGICGRDDGSAIICLAQRTSTMGRIEAGWEMTVPLS